MRGLWSRNKKVPSKGAINFTDNDFCDITKKKRVLVRGEDTLCPDCGSANLLWRYSMWTVFCRGCGSFFDFEDNEFRG